MQIEGRISRETTLHRPHNKKAMTQRSLFSYDLYFFYDSRLLIVKLYIHSDIFER